MTRATGNDRKGKKKKQGKVFGTIRLHSGVCPRYLVSKLKPLLDMRDIQINVKRIQQLHSQTHWALGACSANVDPLGVHKILKLCFEIEIRNAKAGTKLAEILEVPDFVVVTKALRLFFDQNPDAVTNLQAYALHLRKAMHLEVAEQDVPNFDVLMVAVEKSRILRKYLHRKTHVIFLRGGAKDGAKINEKIEGHMAIQANSATMEVMDIQDLHRTVQVKMAPLQDGTVPDAPRKYTSVLRELTSVMSSDGRQLIDSMIPNLSGPDEGSVTVVFRQSPEAEQFVSNMARDPCAFLHHLSLNETGFREDMVFSLGRSFTASARGRVPDTKWDSENWAVITPHSTIGDVFLDELHEEGYTLPNSFIVDIPSGTAIVAETDQAEAMRNLGLRDDATLATRAEGVSIVSGGGQTLGDGSVRSTNTQAFYRNVEQECIDRAAEMERQATARWGSSDQVGNTQGSGTSPAAAEAAATHPPANTSAPSEAPPQAPPGNYAPGFTPPPPSNQSSQQSNTQNAPPTESPATQSQVGTSNDGEPASEKLRGLGDNPPNQGADGGAEGPRGPR